MDLGFGYYTHHLSFTATLSHRFSILSDSIVDFVYGTDTVLSLSTPTRTIAHDQHSRTALGMRCCHQPSCAPRRLVRYVRRLLSAPSLV